VLKAIREFFEYLLGDSEPIYTPEELGFEPILLEADPPFPKDLQVAAYLAQGLIFVHEDSLGSCKLAELAFEHYDALKAEWEKRNLNRHEAEESASE
jgi:hypothetical protein